MHEVTQNGLEDYLAGDVRRDVRGHLDHCASCVRELEEIGSVSNLLGALRADAAGETLAPPPGFYARVSAAVEGRKAASVWNLFSMDGAFGRRLAFASLMTLGILGGFLISRESDPALEMQGPEAIMASHDAAAPHDEATDRDRLMVTLASYDH
ncbi:MAG: hypothetical protein M3Z09_16885 [Acidobacteriota bacterium]|nr:hypothetical protein [Acidobacteriota bacterium]